MSQIVKGNNMNVKTSVVKFAAAALSFCMLAGMTGCDGFQKPKPKEVIGEIMEDYEEAIEDMDADAIIDLTGWGSKDKQSQVIRDCFDYDVAESLEKDYYEFFASTVELDYDVRELEIDGDEAVLEVEYSIIDWEEVFDDLTQYGPAMDLDDISADDYGTNTVDGKIYFERDGKEWIITKITKLDKVYNFIGKGPFGAEPVPTSTIPNTDPDPALLTPTPTPSGIDYNAIYSESCRAYVDFLKDHEKEIRFAEERYNNDFVNLYDLDADGILDLFFVSSDDINDDYSSASLHIYTYDVNKKEVVEKVTVPEICYMAEGGSFFIYVTQGSIVINYSNGEEAFRHVYSEVYSIASDVPYVEGFTFLGRFRRDVHYDYDPDTGAENYTYEYYFSPDGITYNDCKPETYEDSCGFLVNNAMVIVGYDALPIESEFEYPVSKLPDLGFISYDDAIMTYKDI